MHDREDAAADALGRIFAGIGEGERLLGAEPDAGDEAADDQQRDARRQRAEDGEDAEQQQVELIDEPAAEPVREFALAGGADGQAENGGAADQAASAAPAEAGLDDERHQRAEHGEIDDVAEISRGDQPDDAPMQRRNFRVVQRRADEAFDGLRPALCAPLRCCPICPAVTVAM